MYCENCGSNIPEGSAFCSNCGAKVEPRQLVNQQPVYNQPYTPQSQLQQKYIPVKPRKNIFGLVTIVTASAVVAICVGSYFLFFAPDQDNQTASQFVSARNSEEPTLHVTDKPTIEPTIEPTLEPTVEPTVEPTPEPIETVSEQTITVNMDYDSGEGIYTGEVKDGIPNGYGRFEMVSSDSGSSWNYEGQWENGIISGEGVMTTGSFVFSGTFQSGLLNGYCELFGNGILLYKGMCLNSMLNGQGTLYTESGTLIFEGMFENDMLIESADARQARGAAFILECADMDTLLYDACMAEDNTFGYPIAVWGFPIAMSEQTSTGSIIIGHMGEGSYPVCLEYRYAVDETRMTGEDWINAWGVVTGLYQYEDADGNPVYCPEVEVIYWTNDQEGL